MRAKGFADNSSDRVEGGRLKCAIRVLPLEENDLEEELLEEESMGSKLVGMFSSKARRKKEMKEINRKNSAYVADEEGATMPREDFLALQRLIGGGPAALLPQNILVRAFVVRGKSPLDPWVYATLTSKLSCKVRKKPRQTIDKVRGDAGSLVLQDVSVHHGASGCSQLQFSLYDWDRNGGDDLIGCNTVDLEDRWFSAQWQMEFSKMPPLEVRRLTSQTAIGTQGLLELWVEMYEANDTVPKPLTISPPPVVDIEMRVVVFKARNMVNKDVGGQNDLFFKISLVGIDHKQTRFGEMQETDTHYFAIDGKGSFNYRLIYRFTPPA